MKKQSGFKKICFLLALSTCLLISSCEPFDVTSPEDYIGPRITPEPNAAPAAPKPSVPEVKLPGTGPISITITDSSLMALENNKSLMVQRYNPEIQRTFVQQELAIFDPDLTGTVSYSYSKSLNFNTVGIPSIPARNKDFTTDVTLSKFFPTGTTLALDGSTDLQQGVSDVEHANSRLGLTATQSLLRGFGPAVNLASVNQARLDVKISQYELRGFAESLAAQAEETYWNYALAEKQIVIFEQAIDVAQKQKEDIQERIRVGKLAPTELAAAEATLALRREDLINAKSTLVQTRLNLLKLLNPPSIDLWKRNIVIESPPVGPNVELEDVEEHIKVAMKMRTDLNQARLLYQKDELQLVKTKNGLLPKLDMFVTYGRTGFANTFRESVANISDNNYDFLMGVSFEYPIMNRAAKAANYQAIFSRDQQREAINNLQQLVEVDVRSAYQEVIRSREQVTATAVSRKFQEETVRAETEKFKVGKSTSLLVAVAQQSLLNSQITEVQAVVSYLNSFVELYRLDGSLLERRGIASPGREPVKLSQVPGIDNYE
jgi:outer membrane protein